MAVIETFASMEELRQAPTLPQWPEISAAEYARQKANLHLVALDYDMPGARCSIWWENTPPHESNRIGAIGHYAANSQEANNALLDAALKILKEKGCTLVVGPMDGSTWNKYRWITWSNGRPPCFFEMQHPPQWPEYFTAYGLKPFLHYQTRLVADLDRTLAQTADLVERTQQSGLAIRTLDMKRIEQELEAVYAVTAESFAQSPLYMPQDKSAFMQQYMSLLPQVDPDLVFLAQAGDSVVGFIFAIPDVLQKMRGETMDTMICKTTAILPAAYGKRVATILNDWAHHRAREMGFKQALHAFMHEDNNSLRISARYNSELMRRYTLFSKSL